MKPACLVVTVVLLVGLVFMGSPAASAQVDPMQRFFVFKNDTPYPIYPVISAPKDANCSKGDLSSLRIVVNQGRRGAGIPSKGSVTVALPKGYPCRNGGFYNASRIYVLLANLQGFEEKIDPRQRTSAPLPDAPRNLCPNDACWIGQAQADYVGDFPGQLLEYTIISQIGPSASPKGPNDPDGVSVIDFDVSYVDDAYLPVAMALDNGLTGFMGSALPYQDFKTRLTTFLNDPRTDWSAYGVYSQKNWQSQTTFGPGQSPALKVDKIDKLPSGNVVVVGTRAGTIGFSPYYANNSPANPDNYNFTACNDGVHNLACNNFDKLPSGDCCPNKPLSQGGTQLGCCDVKNYLIDRTIGKFIKAGTDDNKNRIPIYSFQNPTFDNIMNRWQKWRQRTFKCQSSPPATPAVDAKAFCNAFQKTFDFAWNEFLLRGKCGSLGGDALDQCVTAAILGYDLKAASPQKCEKCPALPCPQECVTDIQRNESVQALLRSVPWTPAGDPNQCQGCPSARANECPLSCVAPPTYSPKATLWHRDKFLHFWAPYDSAYNLNPFARFVHANVPKKNEGLAAPGAYSFSIDDFYGNYGGPGSTLVIDVGGDSELVNKAAFDPYTQYFLGIPSGWASASVCGRDVKLADPSTGLGTNVPFSFWKADKSGRQKSCEVTVYADKAKTEYVKFKLEELQYTVHDNYTNQDHPGIFGLGGVFAVREGQKLTVPDNQFCCQSSTASLKGRGKCQANLTPGFLNLAYVGVTECTDPANPTCGRPLMTLAIPALSGGAPNTTCK